MSLRPYLLSSIDRAVKRRFFDVLIIGGGIAGLTVAMEVSERWRIGLLTKAHLNDSTTFFAQGGIAAALAENDSPQLHYEDTLRTGAGLCRPEAVRVLVEEGPARVRHLLELCPSFDRDGEALILSVEGAHSVPRVVHAGGDATGHRVQEALGAAVRSKRVALHEEEFVVDLITNAGRCIGAISLNLKSGELTLNFATVSVLASGGAGQVYEVTTNPAVATGDGLAMAYRAGAELCDMEFVQFHPTGLYHPNDAVAPLLTEALRGEGATLRDTGGERFMVDRDPRAELASRDVVVAAMAQVMARQGAPHVYLDATHIDCGLLRERFPTVMAHLAARGYDLCKDRIPVAPAAHYFIGGVVTDLEGRSSLAGLYACGEVANTGIHGASRLASNSLLEGLVFGSRIARHIDATLPHLEEQVRPFNFELPPGSQAPSNGQSPPGLRAELRKLMSRQVGVVRSATGLSQAVSTLEEFAGELGLPGTPTEYELFNLLTVATHTATTAQLRTESRGAHRRSDYPDKDDTRWQVHLSVSLTGASHPVPHSGIPTDAHSL